MQSTGKEKFTVYVYFKTELYNPESPYSDTNSDCDSLESDYEMSSNSSSSSDDDDSSS